MTSRTLPGGLDIRPARSAEPARPGARRLALAVIGVGTMMTFINVSSTIGALSAIAGDLHSSPTATVWISSMYSLVVATFILAAGTAADLFGRRAVFMAGAAAFVLGSGVAVLAPSTGVLIAAQAVMGLGGACVLPAGLSAISELFPDPAERTGAVSIWAASSGVGVAVGPVAAGVLIDAWSWHAVFLVNVVLGAATLIGALAVIPESRQRSRRLDPVGIVLATVAIGSLTFGIIEGRSRGYSSPVILAADVLACAALIAFVRYELRRTDPMLDVRLFRSASFSSVMGVAAVTMFGFTGGSLMVVLYLQRVQGTDALGAGLRILIMFVPFVVVSPLAARLVRRLGFKVLITAGLVMMAVGVLLFLLAGPQSGLGPLVPGLIVAGIGSGLLIAPSTAAAMISVSHRQAGMASSAVNMFRQLGNVLGTAVLGTVLTSQYATALARRLADAEPAERAVPEAFTEAFHSGTLVAGAVLLAAAVPAFLFIRSRPAAA
ncbi:MFS transporter [Gordonia neofelifaecis]|uniref:Drug resistance transporter, EmrB/QacA subfamily protein n=1 Tax=Gordonia neofelifaecis NRRL B-59395 TaxID=644548 RepID=F1YLF6_9ACTN|nr:MFS transporter [Gordonia neofelifaecis]EGD54350.1 drug resistance transporter, EmrB/QacA subfamily protein [Gordonia neofelifaecis NRRL B-59395]